MSKGKHCTAVGGVIETIHFNLTHETAVEFYINHELLTHKNLMYALHIVYMTPTYKLSYGISEN